MFLFIYLPFFWVRYSLSATVKLSFYEIFMKKFTQREIRRRGRFNWTNSLLWWAC